MLTRKFEQERVSFLVYSSDDYLNARHNRISGSEITKMANGGIMSCTTSSNASPNDASKRRELAIHEAEPMADGSFFQAFRTPVSAGDQVMTTAADLVINRTGVTCGPNIRLTEKQLYDLDR